MTKKYYFISDLHLGGDGPLNKCEFETELIDFLKKLEKENGAELIIVGDTFGFWEISKFSGVEKLEFVLRTHKKLFNQFKKTGMKTKITIIPGNHDHDLICNPKFKTILRKYNIVLEAKQHITRVVGGKKIWIEHGNQQDEPTSFVPFGDKNYKPFGYYTTQKILIGAGKASEVAKHPWIKETESVTPDELLPHWLFSNYFYKEMSPLLRYFLLPFIMLFTLSFLILFGLILQLFGVFGSSVSISGPILKLGLVGRLIWTVITIDIVLIIFLLFISIPLFLLVKDFKGALKRYKIIGDEGLKRYKYEVLAKYVKEVFKKHKDVFVYITAHTHNVSLTKKGRKILINTGTWLKRLKRVRNRFKFLPDVYYPTYELSYFKIYLHKKKVAIEYHKIHKKLEKLDLTRLERSLIVLRSKIRESKIPDIIYV